MEQEERDSGLKEKFHEIRTYVKFLWSKKLIISIFACFFGGLFFFRAYLSKPTYTSKVSFMLESQKGGGLSQAMSLVQSFGLGGGNTGISSDKIQALLKSKRIIINTLLLPYPKFNDSVNQGISYCNYWLKNNNKSDTLIQIRPNIENYENLNEIEVKAILPIYEKIKERFLNSNVSSKTDIFDVQFTSFEEELSYFFIKDLLKTLEEFYLTKTTETEQTTYNIIKANIDSVQTELLNKEAQLAEISDQNNNMIKSIGRIKKMTLAREIQILNLMYAESIKSLEMAKFSLLQKKPILQVIDYPQEPIEPEKNSKLFGVIKGIVIGVFIVILFLVLKQFYTLKIK